MARAVEADHELIAGRREDAVLAPRDFGAGGLRIDREGLRVPHRLAGLGRAAEDEPRDGRAVVEREVALQAVRGPCLDGHERTRLGPRVAVVGAVTADRVVVDRARRARVVRTSRSRKREEQGKDQRSRRLHEVTSCFRPWLGRVFLKVPNHAAGSFVLLFSYLFANLSTILTVHRFQ